MAKPDTIVLDQVRHIRGAVDGQRDGMHEVKQCVEKRLDLTNA